MAAPIPPSDVAGGSTATSAWANAVSDAIQQLIADLYPAGALAMAWANVTGKPSTFAPTVHAHAGSASGGTIAYADLTGKPTSMAPTVHAHAGSASGGTVGYADITGKPTSMAPTAHTHPYGSDVTGKPATFAPSDHADAHKTGGGDALVASQINGWNRAAAGSTLGVRIFCGTGTPAGMAEGDIWVIG
jgi:hypothetical protein